MDIASGRPVTEEEIAEVIALIDELRQDGRTDQSLALCRTVSSLTKTPQLALHGILQLIEAGEESDRAALAQSLGAIADAHDDTRWVQFRAGHHFGELGMLDRAIRCYQRSITLKPTARAHLHLARLHRRKMAFEQCIEHLEATLALAPDNREARSDLLYFMAMKGNLERFGELEQEGGFERAHLARCHNRMGQTLVYQGNRKLAMQWFDSAVEMEPDSFRLQWSRHLTVSTSYRSDEDLAESRNRYLAGLARIAEIYEELPEDRKERAHRCAEQLTNFEIHYQSENDIEVQKPYGALFHRVMGHAFPQYMQPMPRRHPGNDRRIRVGFASWGCFFTHSNYKTHGAWITGLNRDRFEVFGYALATTHDQATTRMEREVEHFVPFGGNVDALRQRILADGLDILVYPGIGMEPVLQRLAPFRLAPVQCASWGHPVTTGLPNIDYFLSSELMEPENAQANYTETLVRLPNLGISQIAPELPPGDQYRPPEALSGRERPGKVFVCSQNLLKLMPRHDYLFARILQAVPDAEIWFIASRRKDVTGAFRARMAKICQSYGVDFERRCLLLPRLGKAEFCWVNREADVMLDTSFWSGCNTTFESLVHGTPVITLPGNTLRGRHTWAILRLHGLTELAAGTEQEYVALATRLATDEEYHAEIVARIEAIQGDLFGDDSVITALEGFFERSLTGDV